MSKRKFYKIFLYYILYNIPDMIYIIVHIYYISYELYDILDMII